MSPTDVVLPRVHASYVGVFEHKLGSEESVHDCPPQSSDELQLLQISFITVEEQLMLSLEKKFWSLLTDKDI